MNNQIRNILRRNTNLEPVIATLGDGEDLYGAGLSSLSAVRLMIALEDAFEVDFPEALMNRETFRTIASIQSAILSLRPVRMAA